MRILVVNTGSSSLKLTVLHDLLVRDDVPDEPAVGTDARDGVQEHERWRVEATLDLDRWDGEGDLDRLEPVVTAAVSDGLDAVGHRVVHGGTDLVDATRLTPTVEDEIRALSPLAPLHQPRAVAGIQALGKLAPGVPHVACFDTAFHATIPAAAATYALPVAWRERWGLRRVGFHGLSHAWAVRRAPQIAADRVDAAHSEKDLPSARIVSCHLGAGASLCAARDGRSVDTTMGFTPLEGLVMATRSGSVDPGLVLWLIEHAGLTAREVTDGLEHDAGLKGLTGTSGDMRDVLAGRADRDPTAVAAFDVYVHRLRREIAAMSASLGGVDIVAFTGGVGERAADIRAAALDGFGFLGLALDPVANTATSTDGDISAPDATARTVVVTAREDLEIARQVRALLFA